MTPYERELMEAMRRALVTLLSSNFGKFHGLTTELAALAPRSPSPDDRRSMMKEVRKETGISMMDAQRYLKAVNWDVRKAVEMVK